MAPPTLRDVTRCSVLIEYTTRLLRMARMAYRVTRPRWAEAVALNVGDDAVVHDPDCALDGANRVRQDHHRLP
jgi:hypothetical protein